MRIGAVVMATLMLVLLTGCGDSTPERPPGVFPSFKADLYANPQLATSCVSGAGGDALACTEAVNRTMRTLHTLRDAIKARPDAGKYPDTLAEIDKVDGAFQKYTDARCAGSLASNCDTLANFILTNNVYALLQSEDTIPGGRG
jgi:hypothetical protein